MSETPASTKLPTRTRSSDHAPVDNALARIRALLDALAPGARRIADYVLERPEDVLKMSVTELSEATQASEGSVVNFCQRLGLSGFQQLKLSLAQAIVRPVQFIHEDLEIGDDANIVCRKIFHSGIQALQDTLSVLDPAALGRAVDTLRAARRIEVGETLTDADLANRFPFFCFPGESEGVCRRFAELLPALAKKTN